MHTYTYLYAHIIQPGRNINLLEKSFISDGIDLFFEHHIFLKVKKALFSSFLALYAC